MNIIKLDHAGYGILIRHGIDLDNGYRIGTINQHHEESFEVQGFGSVAAGIPEYHTFVSTFEEAVEAAEKMVAIFEVLA